MKKKRKKEKERERVCVQDLLFLFQIDGSKYNLSPKTKPSLFTRPTLLAFDAYNYAYIQEGATKEDVEQLSKFKFRKVDDAEKFSTDVQEPLGGIMTECDTDSPIERALSQEDAVCMPYHDHIRNLQLCQALIMLQTRIGLISSHVLVFQECCICLSAYEDGVELRELPCGHHFHCACVDKWLYINATCPLCKYNILKNSNLAQEEV